MVNGSTLKPSPGLSVPPVPATANPGSYATAALGVKYPALRSVAVFTLPVATTLLPIVIVQRCNSLI